MGRVAWIEVIDRHREVLCRHPVDQFPIRIGRGYDSDVILDDPYVAPTHCLLDEDGAGGYRLQPLDADHPVELSGRRLIRPTALGAEDVFRCGHTQLRLRPAHFPVPPALPVRRTAGLRHPLALAAALLLLLAVSFLDAWESYVRIDQDNALFGWSAFKILLVLALAIPWALAGRAASGRANYMAHAVAIALMLTAIKVMEHLTEILRFALNADWPGDLFLLLLVMIIAGTLYYQFRLAIRARRMAVLGLSALIAVAGVAVWRIDAMLDANKDMERLNFNDAAAPPAFLIVPGQSVEAYAASVVALRERVDQLANAQMPTH